MSFEYHVVADLIGGEIVDAVRAAVVCDDICPFARKELQEGERGSWTRAAVCQLRQNMQQHYHLWMLLR